MSAAAARTSAGQRAPSQNKVVLRYSTGNHEVSMNFETVEEARQYLAYAIPRKLQEERDNAISGLNIPSPVIIEDSIKIYNDGVKV
jgi:hypothetical protein